MATLLVFSQSTLTPTDGETVSLILSGATARFTIPSGTTPASVAGTGVNEGKFKDYDMFENDWAYYKNTPFEAGDPVDEGTKGDQDDNGVIATYSGHRQSHVSKWWRNVHFLHGTQIADWYDAPANFTEIPTSNDITVGEQENIKLEVVDPIIEPDYTYSEIISIEKNGYWEAGKSYDVVVNEAEEYGGYFASYRSVRNTGLIGTGGTSSAGIFFNSKKGLINQTGIDTLFDSERVYGSTFYQAFADLVNAAVTDGIIDSVTVISETQIENTTGDQDTDLWYDKNTYQRTYRFAVSSTAPAGTNYLVFTSFKDDTVEEFSSGDVTQTYDPVLQVSAFPVRIGIAPPPVPPRPLDYDEDAVWDPIAGGWTTDLADLTTLGGGRYGKRIVVVSNQAKIFFGAL